MQQSVLRLAALAAVAAADSGVAPSSAALRGPSPLAWNYEGEELLWTAEGDEPEEQLGSPRRLDNSANEFEFCLLMVPIFGCFIWLVLPSLIWNNERMSVKQEAFIKKAKDHCVIIDDVNVEPPEILVNHVVFAAGTTSQQETLVDQVFPMIKAENAVRLRRKVEMLQFSHNDESGDHLKWAEEKVKTKIPNPDPKKYPEMPIPSSSRLDCVQAPAGSVKMGVFSCGAFVRRDMKNWETLDPKTIVDEMKSCPALEGKNLQTAIKGCFVYFVEGSVDPAAFPLGTFRVAFEVLKCGPLAVLGVLEKKDGWSFLPLLHEHCAHSHALCDDITCKQRPNPHWTGRKEDLSDLTAAVEKIETELNDVERSSLDAKLLTQQTEDFDATDVTSGQKKGWMSKVTAEALGHEDFIPLTENCVGYKDFINITASNSVWKVRKNRISFMFLGVCGVWMILAPIMFILSIPICLPWSFFCIYPGLPFALLLCAGGFVCSSSCTALLMAVSLVRFRPLMSILLFSWFALATVTLFRMQSQDDEVRPGYIH